MKADFTRCSCSRMNDPWRKYCGGCGRRLEPECCGFVNAKSDDFCGGCGTKVGRPARTTQESTIPIDVTDIVGSASARVPRTTQLPTIPMDVSDNVE